MSTETKTSSGKKIMVFMTNMKQIDTWQEKMICSTFAVGRSGNEESLSAFRQGRSQVMMTTSALGVGMNFDDVGVMFQLGVTFSTEDFIQQSGRDGREGNEFKSIMVIDEREFKRLKDRSTHMLPQSRQILHKMIIANECRRLSLNEAAP